MSVLSDKQCVIDKPQHFGKIGDSNPAQLDIINQIIHELLMDAGKWMGHFQKYHNTLFCPPKLCISIVFISSWDHCKSQEKMETTFMQNFGGQTKSIMVFLKVAHCLFCVEGLSKHGLGEN